MIKSDDLILWIREHSIGKSITVLNGWIRGSELYDLACKIMSKEPFDYLLEINKDQ